MKSIRSKLLICMLAVSFSAVIILGLFSNYYIKKSVKNTLKDTIVSVSQQACDSLNYQLEILKNSFNDKLNICSKNPETTDYKTLLENIQALYSTNSSNRKFSFAIYDENGTLTDWTSSICKEILSNDNVSHALNSDELTFTDVVSFNNTLYISMLSPIVLSNGTEYVIAMTSEANNLNSTFKSILFSENCNSFVMNKDFDIILDKNEENAKQHYNPKEKTSNDNDSKSFVSFIENAFHEPNKSAIYKYDGKEFVGGYTKCEYLNALVFVTAPIDNFTSSSRDALLGMSLIGLLLMISSCLCSIIFAKKISNPIVTVTNRICELAKGNLSDHVEISMSKDEIGILSSSLADTIISLRQYITLITNALIQISEGNMYHKVEGDFKGDFIKIKDTFNKIIKSLSETFDVINSSAEQVNAGAVQVSNSAQTLSQGSTQQASAIEELSATLNDISTQVKQNSKDSEKAYNIVIENTNAIGNCNNDMTNMLEAMKQINSSASEISNIIKVIDEIAFQTNILALNAAVEAAREGSKGFSVVADEVRRLASKSAEAAKQTSALIENSTNAVNKGSKLAEQTAASLKDVVNRSYKIQEYVKNITDASSVQAEAIIQINTGVEQISTVVSTNTSTAVGAASASEELSEQSLILKNMIATFKLSDTSSVSDDNDNSKTDLINKTKYSENKNIPGDAVKIILDDDDDKY